MPLVLHRHDPQCYTDNRSRKRLPTSSKRWPIKPYPTNRSVYLEQAPTYDELKKDFACEKTSALQSKHRLKEEPLVTKISQAVNTFRKKKLRRDKLLLSEPPRVLQPLGPVIIKVPHHRHHGTHLF